MFGFFSNPGGAIKTFAKIIFAVMVITAIIVAFVIGFETNRVYDYYTDSYVGELEFYFVPFILTLLGGNFAAFIGTVFIYAFGELVENSTKIYKKLDALEKKNSYMTAGAASGAVTAAHSAPASMMPEEEDAHEEEWEEEIESVVEEHESAAEEVKRDPLTAKKLVDNALMFTGAEGSMGYIQAHYDELDEAEKLKLAGAEALINGDNAVALRYELERLQKTL